MTPLHSTNTSGMAWLAGFGLCLFACGQGGTSSDAGTGTPDTTGANVDDAHNSRNSVVWAGTYTGTVPCADCEGIATQLTLHEQGTYRSVTQYLGKNGEQFVHEGRFKWEAYGNRIRLEGMDNGPARYLVGEEKLIQLDGQGARITGGLTETYILRRVATTTAIGRDLEGTYWMLVEVSGKPVTPMDGRMAPHLLLNAGEQRAAGNAGCNSFFSTYELDKGTTGIRFSKAGSTMMACPDMSVEDAFHKALLQVEGYSIAGEELSLNNGAGKMLLRFKAVDP